MSVHVPILVGPILEGVLEPFLKQPENSAPYWFVDCTLGGGGHTSAFLEAFAGNPKLSHNKILALDQDFEAVSRARERFKKEIAEGRIEIEHAKMSEASKFMGDKSVFGLMADLGFSSDQIEDPSRGLSFQKSGPLDMRLDSSKGMSCLDRLRTVSERDLEKILSEFGEERFSRRIAQALVRARQEKSLPKTTEELRELIFHAVPPPARHGRIHPATRTFQALRIWTNDEMKELDQLLGHVILSIKPGGRVAVLSFHSLEDRRVKTAFKERDGEFRQITKKPIEPDENEILRNPVREVPN